MGFTEFLARLAVRSLKSVVDRLKRFHRLKGRHTKDSEAGHAHGRPFRDRAMVYLLLSTVETPSSVVTSGGGVRVDGGRR